MRAKHLAECLVPGENSIDVIGDADTDDRDDGGDGESREGSSQSSEIHWSLPLCSSIYCL